MVSQRLRNSNPTAHICDLPVHLHQLVDVKLGGFDNFRLADVDTLYRVDPPRSLLNLPTDSLRNELLNKFLKVARGSFPGHNFEHLFPDLPDLGGLSIGGFADLVRPSLCESNGEQSDNITVSGFDIDVGFDEGLPLADEGAQFVGGEVHAVEVC